MLFDIGDGRSLEDIIQRMWDHEWSQSFQGRVLPAGEAQGCQWFDVVMRGMEGVLDHREEDPAECARIMARWPARSIPFGPDPILGGTGCTGLSGPALLSGSSIPEDSRCP